MTQERRGFLEAQKKDQKEGSYRALWPDSHRRREVERVETQGGIGWALDGLGS